MNNDFGELIAYLDEKFQAVEERFLQLPTKTYLDDKIANLEGGLLTKLRKEDEKINRLAEILKERGVLKESDIKELEHLQIFPKQA